MVTAGLAARLEAAAAVVRPLGRVLVAYSGGVDSAVVAEIARRELGDRAEAVIARSPSLPRSELDAAVDLAAQRGINLRVVDTAELELEGYRANQPDRCYHCKTELYTTLVALGRASGASILDGFNRDDRGDWRPGRRAAVEAGVLSPLDIAGMGKEDVRAAAREMGLRNWEKPAAACLSSRIPYGTPITVEMLGRVESAEAALRAEGFGQLRVRDRGGVATLEVERAELARLRQPLLLARIRARLLSLGFHSVEVDPLGYRAGNLNVAGFQAE